MNGVSKITVTEDEALITFTKLPADHKVIAEILNRFAQEKINIDMISQTAPQSEYISFSFTVQGEFLVPVLELIQKFTESYPTLKPFVSSGNCKIQLYGEEMRTLHGVAARAMEAVASVNADIIIITTSEIDISFLTTNACLDEAVAALEATFQVQCTC